jgi:molecular chaperone HscB
MNYFDLFQIPVSIRLDKDLIKTKFYQLSRQYHPDRYTNAPEDEQSEALERSSMINKAWKTFQKEDEIIRYVLSLHNLIEEEGKYELSPAFLMEVMELNEELMEIDLESDSNADKLADIKSKLEQLITETYKNVEETVEGYQENTISKEKLLQLKDYYYKKKYLQRILDKIEGMRNIASRF